MAYKSREEIVGKRFLSVVSGFTKLKLGKISEWGWRAGVIRAATHKDNSNKDLQVLVEYDDVEWHRREWISIYKDSLFHMFMVEQGLYWAERTDPFAHTKSKALWPALTFTSLVSTVDLSSHLQPVEFLLDRELAFADLKQLKPFQEWDPKLPGVRDYPELKSAVRRWAEQQDGQRILLATPSVLVGYRVEVYRAEGTTQWYTAVIVGYNEATRDLTVTDDTVLEEHNEDPALVQMRLIGDGVVESIMRGENVGITPRRSRSAVLQTQHQQQPGRVVRGFSGVNASTAVSTRKPRTGKAESILQTSPEPPDKGLNAKNTRKRKVSENESAAKLKGGNASFCNTKEDLENKQGRKRNGITRSASKKKVLEEANNSKLRDLQVRVEDCLQNAVHSEALSAVCRRAFEESVAEEVADTSGQEEVEVEAVSPADPATASPEPVVDVGAGSPPAEPVVEEVVAVAVDNDSALDDSSNGSSVQLVPVEEIRVGAENDGSREDSVPVLEPVVTEIASEEDDCVIVAQRTTPKHEERECSSRGDDDGPLSSSSPFSRMELAESVGAASLLRFPDDRSDSGVSSLRSGSGDERSGSRSSALSSSDEPQNTNTQSQPTNRSPLFIPSSLPYTASTTTSNSGSASEPVRVWRDPSLLLESEPHVRHIHSVQHQSLLMSHPSAPAASGPPPTSAAAASLYPAVPPPPTLMSPHPIPHHPHLPPPALYPHHLTDVLWKQRYPLPVSAAHLLAPQAAHPAAEELLDRERAYAQDRDRHERLLRERQNQESREIEKHKEKERERHERDKIDREREREKHEREQEQERERQEKQRTQQAVQKHFEESLKRAQHKQGGWNLISMPPPNRGGEDERKRVEHEHHQREQQQRHMSAAAAAAVAAGAQARSDVRDRNTYYAATSQRQMSGPGKDYPPPAHSRVPASSKSSEKLGTVHASLPKAEVNMFGYPAYQPTAFFSHEPKSKSSSEHHKMSSQSSGLVVTKSGNSVDRERDMLPNPPPLMSEPKNSVIVKHDAKNPHHLDTRVSIAHSPKLRPEMMGHYLTAQGQSHKGGLYEYRSPTQSPHHLPHAPSPHHMQPENLGKSPHHRSGQLPSPHHQRQSPHQHPHAQQHPSPEMRYRSNSESQAMIYPSVGKGGNMSAVSYPYIPSSTVSHYTVAASTVSNSKPKVSSPAPHHIYGKPSAGIGSGLPTTRSHETTQGGNPIPLTSKPPLSSSVSPSPYQQVSQYHPPHQQNTSMPTCLPPPAHSKVSPSPIFERMYPGGVVPGGLSVKPSVQHGTSPPTAASAPSPVSRSHMQYLPPGVTHPSQNIPSGHSMQTQPLDLGVSSNKYDSSLSPKRKGTPVNNLPVCLEVKKRRVEGHSTPPAQVFSGQPQLARVSEPSPLIASAATTITTVVNTAAYRGPPSVPPSQSPSVLSEVLPDVSVMPIVSVPNERPPSLDSNASSVVSTVSSVTIAVSTSSSSTSATVSEPTTPIKTTSAPTATTPSAIDSEKSNSPVPSKSANYPVRHLKKAWLQRHTGEDVENTTGLVGSGSCVTLPININNTVKETAPVTKLHNIGSMAVNSINKTKPFPNKTNNRKGHKESSSSLNGHPVDTSKGDDSSSSDQERGRKSPPKRKPPKVKRKKGAGAPKKTPDEKKRKVSGQSAAASESGSDSDKESISDKDSDSGASTTVPGKKSSSSGSNSVAAKDKEPRKRGRRPKTKNDKGEEPRAKKSKDELVPQRDPFRKPPVGQLKKTGESFLQDGPCFEVAPKLAKCRECRWTPNQRSKNMPNIFCRFYAFRRLRYTKNGQLAIAGFSDPHKDALEEDIKLWLPLPEQPPADLDLETSRFILKQVGDHFCNLLMQEKDAHSEHMSDDKTIAWKRVVQGVREMCDVCETTLFNFHWACGKCGFVVCLDCYKGRKSGSIKIWGEPGKDRDDYSWLLCTNRQAHEQEKLMLTQIIAGDSLLKLGKLVHEMRELWNVEQYCGCSISKEVTQKSNSAARKEIIKGILNNELNGIKKEIKEDPDTKSLNGGIIDDKSGLSWFADVALSTEEKKTDDSSDSDEGSFSTLRELLIRPSHKPNGSRATSPVSNQQKPKKPGARMDTLDEVISSVIEDSVPKHEAINDNKELKHFVPRDNALAKSRGTLPIRIMTLTESKLLYPDTPHTWLCDGKLLRLSDSNHSGNNKIFQDQWKRGQPVLVSDVSKYLDKELWSPEAFIRDFGDEKNDLVNCLNGNIVVNQPMRKFWDGFEHFMKRLKDERGNPMLLKLKDWPPGEDFAEMLPSRFADLMKVLPLSEYTHRNGRLNLASRLPDCFVRPDLGPKMYNAYGSALHPSKGTTNLHLDISDAVNVMVYVGIPKDSDSDEHIKEAFRAIDEAGCDILTRRRVRDKGELPGALWHIYQARDADKIRDLLNKVVVEKGGILKPNHDPIHDQSCYLDGPLRERLYKEYGVEGYAIVQCLGDAVFIPAGAPHQVRNLHNCIKIAEDFVSPENVSHCFHLTQEFRDLSDTHSNHEDKLQIKNIIFHAVKDSLSTLTSILNKHVKSEKDSTERNGNSGAGGVGGGGADTLQNSTMDSSEPA